MNGPRRLTVGGPMQTPSAGFCRRHEGGESGGCSDTPPKIYRHLMVDYLPYPHILYVCHED